MVPKLDQEPSGINVILGSGSIGWMKRGFSLGEPLNTDMVGIHIEKAYPLYMEGLEI